MGACEISRAKLKRASEQDDKRGYKYDAELNLHGYLERSGPLALGAGEAEGFKARDLRTGSEPSSPEEAKQVLDFFKNREKPPAEEKITSLRDALMKPKKTAKKATDQVSSILRRHRQLRDSNKESIDSNEFQAPTKQAFGKAKSRMGKNRVQDEEDETAQWRKANMRNPARSKP